MADVFISYHRKSASVLVRRIADELESIGISCWYDKKEEYIGGISEVIIKEIEHCKVFLLIWDEGASKSNYVKSEVLQSFNDYGNGITPIPFRLGHFKDVNSLEFYFRGYNIMNGGDFPETANITELIRRIANALGVEPIKATATAQSSAKPETQPEEAAFQNGALKRIIKQGVCGAAVNYTLYEGGILVISGIGAMQHYRFDEEKKTVNTPWFDKRSSIAFVRVKSGVTSIGDNAFRACALTRIVLPESVTHIGAWAFRSCNTLTDIKIPDSVSFIGEQAFAYCSHLTQVHISNGVSNIGAHAFAWCQNLPHITIPATLISIRAGTFQNCDALVSVKFPDGLTSIGDNAFYQCASLTSVDMPDSVISIGNSAFSDCNSLAKVHISKNVVSIGDYAFSYCSSLNNVYIPDGITDIKTGAFRYCSSLTRVNVPGKVRIEYGAFSNRSLLNPYRTNSAIVIYRRRKGFLGFLLNLLNKLGFPI